MQKTFRSYRWIAPGIALALVLVWAVLWPLTNHLAAGDVATISGLRGQPTSK